ncbi:MAG: hypothetical protein MJ068_00085 [Clostridia bacterium]|nr:hypothetical protein [Clostridia bacterium]
MIKRLIKFLIGIAAFVVIIVIIGVVLINLTPRQLKIADIEIAGMSFDSLGIADTKLIDIYKSFNHLSEVKESDVVNHPYVETEEKSAAESATEGSSVAGSDNYSSIVGSDITYDKKRLIEYKDTTLAYMINNAVTNSDSSDENVQYLKDAHMSIRELALTNNGEKKMRIVCYVDLTAFTSQIEENLPSAAKSFLKIPEQMFIVSEYTITDVDSEGKLVLNSDTICINGNNEDPVTKAIVKVIISISGQEGGIDEINNKIGEAVSGVIGHLGKIGTAETVSATDNTIKTGTEVIGISGLGDGKLSVITHVAD